MNRKNVYLLLSCISFFVLFGIIPAFAGFTDDYNHNQDIEFYNSGTATIRQPLIITQNTVDLIDYGYIQSDADDVTIDYLGNEEYITVTNLSGTQSQWRTEYATIKPDATLMKTLWFGNSMGTRNQSWIGSVGDTNSLAVSGSITFSGTEAFAIRCDVTPAVNPATRQWIFGIDNSYELSLDPGPLYRWYCVGSGAPSAAATLSATVDTRATLIAWHNGPAGEIMLCDSTAGQCAQASFSDLKIGNTVIPPLTFDGVIDDLSIRIPDFPASGTPPGAPGTPPGGGAVASVCVGDFIYEPLASDTCYGRDYYDDDPNNTPNDYVEYFKVDVSAPALCAGGATTRYGFDLSFPVYAETLFDPVDAADVSYYNDSQLLSEVSLSLSIRSYCTGCYRIQLSSIDRTGSSDAGINFANLDVGTCTTQSVYTVNSGSLTIDMHGTNWTIGKLKEYNWSVRIAETYSACKTSYACGTYGAYDPYNCADVDVYIESFEVNYRVAP